MSGHISLSIHPTLSCNCVHGFILYICTSASALQTGSSVATELCFNHFLPNPPSGLAQSLCCAVLSRSVMSRSLQPQRL